MADISAWLLYDYEHVPVIGTQRASVWELRPIMKIEVKKKANGLTRNSRNMPT